MFKKIYFLGFLLFSPFLFALSNTQSLNDANTYIDVGQNNDALKILKDLENLSVKESAERDYLLGKLYFSLGKYYKANEFYDLAALANSEEPKYLVGLSESYFVLGKLKIAKSNAEFALRSNPDLVSAELIIAKIEDKLGNREKALQRFKKLYDMQPKSEAVVLNYAKFLESRSEIGSSINLLENFLLKSPNSPLALDYLGQLYWFDGNVVKAITLRTKAWQLFEEQNKKINSKSIKIWIEKNKIEIDDYPTPNIKDKKNPVYKDEIAKPKSKIKKPRYVLNTPGQLEPFPVSKKDWVGTGSGFIVSNGGEVITNRHVVEGALKIYVRNGLGELRRAYIKYISESDDLAVLTLSKKYNSNYSLQIPSDLDLRVGMDAIIMGYPLTSVLGDSSPSLTEGIVSKNTGLKDNSSTFLLTSKLNKGNSGGPIFSSNGELIGVAVAKLNKVKVMKENDFIPEDVNIGIKINRVREMLNLNNVINASIKKMDLSDLYEQKLQSVVMIVSILPTPKEYKKNNSEDEYTIKDAIKDCKKDYKSDNELNRSQYNKFCECYIHGIADAYDNKEGEYERENGKFSPAFEEKIQIIGDQCFNEVK